MTLRNPSLVQITRMLSFLDYSKREKVIMDKCIINGVSFPSCNIMGHFYLHTLGTYAFLSDPDEELIEYAAEHIKKECKTKLLEIQRKRKFPDIHRLLAKFYRLPDIK